MKDDYESCLLNAEKELLRYMLAAPASEIDSMIPSSIRDCEELLGITRAYDYRVDYFPMEELSVVARGEMCP